MFSMMSIIKTIVAISTVLLVTLKPEIPYKMIIILHAKTVELTKFDWGCPSPFNKNACKEYDPDFYKSL